jgi:hypothetical protein
VLWARCCQPVRRLEEPAVESPAQPQPSPHIYCSCRRCLRALLLLGAAAALASCASVPQTPAWPPRQGEPVRMIRIYAERFHSSLSLPAPAPGKLEEWSYGERVWFYDERGVTPEQRRKEYVAAVTDTFRALFWPNSGVIELTRAVKPYNERNPQSNITVWEIPVTEEGLRRMREYLDRSIGSHKALLDDGGQAYYVSSTRYHVFHTCNHYVALALQAGGVPVHPGYCLIPTGLWLQLNRLEQSTGTPAPVQQTARAGSAPGRHS